MQVRYFDECQWKDVGDGLIYHFVDDAGDVLAEIALRDGDAKLWKFEINVPERYRWHSANPAGVVYTMPAARKIAELILLSTIVTKTMGA